MSSPIVRRLPIGAEVVEGGAHFRVWAPKCKAMQVVVEGAGSHAMECEKDGHFSAFVADVKAGARYRFRTDDSKDLFPTPLRAFNRKVCTGRRK